MESIITEYTNISVISGLPKECTHHCIFGNGRHKLADKDGLTIPMTHAEHNTGKYALHENSTAEMLSKILGQLAWEKEYISQRTETDLRKEAREAFRKRYGESYL